MKVLIGRLSFIVRAKLPPLRVSRRCGTRRSLEETKFMDIAPKLSRRLFGVLDS